MLTGSCKRGGKKCYNVLDMGTHFLKDLVWPIKYPHIRWISGSKRLSKEIRSCDRLHSLCFSVNNFTETEKHRMVWKGLQRSCCSNPLPWDIFHSPRLLRVPSSLALNTSRAGAPTVSLGSLVQCLTTLTVKDFSLMSLLNLSPFSLISRFKLFIYVFILKV